MPLPVLLGVGAGILGRRLLAYAAKKAVKKVARRNVKRKGKQTINRPGGRKQVPEHITRQKDASALRQMLNKKDYAPTRQSPAHRPNTKYTLSKADKTRRLGQLRRDKSTSHVRGSKPRELPARDNQSNEGIKRVAEQLRRHLGQK